MLLTEAQTTPIVIDTREQKPYGFDPAHVTVTRRALPAGDYSLAGQEESVAVERKSLPDFVSSVVHHRDRFERELERLSSYEAACVLVEADLRDVAEGRYRSHAHPNAVLGSVIGLFVRYGVPILFCSTREIAARFTAGYLQRFHVRATVACEVDDEGRGPSWPTKKTSEDSTDC